MLEPTRIEDVRERVRDFTKALREAGAEDVAQRIEGYAAGFVDSTQVRRSVDAIKQQLRYFRAYPEELPDLPVVQIAANRLEDVCKDALRAELIQPARLSLRAQSKRKLSVVVTTLSAAVACLLLPLGIALFGVDVEDLFTPRRLAPLRVPKGESRSLTVNALLESPEPRATQAVEFYVAGACPPDMPGGASCRPAGERWFGSEKLRAYEVMLSEKAYGLYIGFSEARLIGKVGTARVHVSAGPETPEGQYEVPLAAAFVGFTPERCNLLLKLQDRCEPAQRGPRARQDDVPVSTVVFDVVPGGKTQSAAEIVAAHNAAQRKRAAERAAQIAGAVVEIKAVLNDTQRELQRKRYDVVQERMNKLTALFEPLDAMAVAGAEADPLPAEVVSLRARFEAEQRALAAFRARAFEVAYEALSKKPAGERDARVFARVSQKLGVSTQMLEQIYAEHADELEKRMQRAAAAAQNAEQKRMDALLQRCGPLPKTAWQSVRAYLAEHVQQRGRVQLQECMTPRLDPKRCWSVVCDFEQVVPSEDIGPDRTLRLHWYFRLQAGRVVEHSERVPADAR